MVELGLIHYIYITMIFIILLIMLLKKDVVLPCITAIGIIGYVFSRSLLKTVQIIFNAIVVSGREFIEIIIIISLVNAMSKILKDMGADELMIKPIKKLMINSSTSFFVLGGTMMIISWFIWPTPAVAFIGAIMVPAAISAGLPAIWAAVALDLFGNGAALSSDYFIQAAPSITSKTAGIDDPFQIIKASGPLWAAMTIVTIAVAYGFMKKDIEKNYKEHIKASQENIKNIDSNFGTKLIAGITPVAFFFDILLMYIYKLKGGNATALIGGTAVIIMSAAVIIKYNFKNALGKITGYIVEGFMFGMKVFAPIIIIGAFFFLGSKETASMVFQVETDGFLTDIGMYLSSKIPLSKISVILMQTGISAMLGVGGSGFSGLPLVGTLAQVFSGSIGISKEGIAALGQIVTIWIGGGTIIPWSVVPIAAVCDVEPFDIVRKNLIPVLLGITATIIFAVILL